MKDALMQCKRFVDAGLIDPDIWTTNPRDKAISGNLGLVSLEWSVLFKASYVKQILAVNPNARWSYFGPLKSEVGAPDVFYPIDGTASKTFLCVNADLPKDKLAGLFRLIDYLTTEEGSMLVNFGLEGVHWTRNENGEAFMTDRASEANYVATYQLLGREDKQYLGVKFKEAKDQIAYAQSMPHIWTYNSLIEIPDGFYLNDFEKYVKNQLIAFIYGDRPISEYDAFLKELDSIYGFNDYMASAAEQLKGYGYIK
jgi:hypothetical protein